MENRCRWILTRITLAELTALLVIAGHCMVCGARASTRSISSTAHFEHRALLTPNAKDVQNTKKIPRKSRLHLSKIKANPLASNFDRLKNTSNEGFRDLQSIYSWGTSDPSSLHQNISKHIKTLFSGVLSRRGDSNR